MQVPGIAALFLFYIFRGLPAKMGKVNLLNKQILKPFNSLSFVFKDLTNAAYVKFIVNLQGIGFIPRREGGERHPHLAQNQVQIISL